eukprot:CAMPEP_0117751248 /NCGR_PEP_ID=MMETSP0947-20121206/10857_1 /TAXON_ID=44440 /ORGANISM="Chattonella subsalsa, Strain CCMP2191" /LENGTH=490 /DNA_ID=CAMNT_0005569583 /DNA_START=415 /DNA_END=1887 /DNA_ORIENTATION=-
MGAGASVEGDTPNMSDEAKRQLVSRMKEIYEQQRTSEGINDLAIFDEMKKAYETVVKEVIPQDLPANGKKKQRRPSALGGTDAQAAAAAAAVEEDPDIAAARAAAAQIEQPSPKNKKDFRKRRLTLTTRRQKGTDKESSGKNTSPATNGARNSAGGGANGAKGPSVRTRRQSITRTFQSHEIGDVPEIPQPFPLDHVGTYSCHGIEPSWDDDGYTAKINQDRGTVCHPYANSDLTAFFAVFDGHGEKGDKVSHFVMSEVQKHLEKHSSLSTDPPNALKETFVKVNRLIGEKNIECMYSGTTAVAVYMHSGTMWTANAGDSRAVMAKNQGGKLVAENLSIDHNPDAPEEKARILAAGGFVSPPPEPGLSARVWLDPEMTQIGLAMARSIGDHAVKHIGVIPEPEVFQREISSDDQFMILATDGVWEFIESQEAVNIVAAHLSNGATAACQKLIETAAERWRYNEGDYRDDITAIVAKLPCVEVANPQSVPG